MGTDFYSLNKVILAGQVFLVTKIDKKKKTQYIRLGTKEVFLYGKKKSPKPTSYYHLIRTTGSLSEYCAKYISVGDFLIIEGRLRNFASSRDKTIWKSVVLADKIVTITKLEWLKDDLKEKFKSAIDKK
jgi:hypothetical protein